MKKKRGYKFMLIIYCFVMIIGTTVGYSIYIINDNNVVNISDVATQNPNKQLNKVTFKESNGTIIDTVYVPVDEPIDSSNTPTIGSNRIKWHEGSANSGTIRLDLCDKNRCSFIPVSKNTELFAEVVTTKDNLSNVVIDNNKSNGNPNGSNTTLSGNSIDMIEKTGADKNHVCNDISIGGSLDGVSINAKYKGRAKKDKTIDTVTNDLSFYTGGLFGLGSDYLNQANSDDKIGLDDTASPVSMYKPNKSNNVNYCVNRIVLSSDLIITNSTLNVGAMVGFYGDLFNWSQRNMQGFIIGNYSEIDLNGHNLIVGDKGVLNAYGSIINSIPDKGQVIIENGGKLLSTCVIEEHNAERALPLQYIYGCEIFSYYRMPYLNCSIKINQGGKVDATIKLDFGGSNSNYCDVIINLIGSSSSYICQMNSQNGYIIRKSKFDKELYDICNTFEKNNLMAQRISYEVYDSSIKLNTNIIKASIAGANFTIDLSKNGYMIPHYFEFKLYNTQIEIPMSLTFLPGSYLFIDEQSSINLSSTIFSNFNPPTIVMANIHAFTYQTVGSLNFVMEKYNFKDAINNSTGWVDDTQDGNSSNNGQHMLIRRESTNLISYINKNKRAKADILGIIKFSNIIEFNNNSLRHQLGGEINIKNLETFKTEVSTRNDVDLYSSAAHMGPFSTNNATLGKHKVNATEFFVSPLISNGNVLMDFNNQGKVRDNFYSSTATYDKKTGIITYLNRSTGAIEYYAFIHTNDNSNWNGDISHARKSYYKENEYKNNKDNYCGQFFKVSLNSNNSITAPINANGKNNYIFFRGAFMPFDGTNVYTDKLRAVSSALPANNGLKRQVSYVDDTYYGYKVWRIVK